MLREIEIASNSFAIKKKVTRFLLELGYTGLTVQEIFYRPGCIELKFDRNRPGALELTTDYMCSELTTELGQGVTAGDVTTNHVILKVWNRS